MLVIYFVRSYRREVCVTLTQSRPEVVKQEWRRPVLRKLPIAATASKSKGNEGQGGGKGDNIIVS